MDWLRIVPQLTVIRNGIKTFSCELEKKNKNQKTKVFFFLCTCKNTTATLQPSRDAGKHTEFLENTLLDLSRPTSTFQVTTETKKKEGKKIKEFLMRKQKRNVLKELRNTTHHVTKILIISNQVIDENISRMNKLLSHRKVHSHHLKTDKQTSLRRFEFSLNDISIEL